MIHPSERKFSNLSDKALIDAIREGCAKTEHTGESFYDFALMVEECELRFSIRNRAKNLVMLADPRAAALLNL